MMLSADERERAGDVAPHHQHDQRNDHAHHHQGLHVGLAVGDTAVRGAVDETDHGAEDEGEDHHQHHVRYGEGAGEVSELIERVGRVRHERVAPVPASEIR